jgi:signal transduction histidine kinase
MDIKGTNLCFKIINIYMQISRKTFQDFRALKISLSLKFVIGTGVVLILAMALSTYFITEKNRDLIIEQLDIQAKTLFSQIVLTRRWIADHGGVFVEKFPWKKSSPYLSDADLVDLKGKKYMKESPAMVTKELSRYAREEGAYWFNITSLKLTNPENAPDEFEEAALKKFEAGLVKDDSRIEEIDSSLFYRYIAPLYVEEACLKCHSHQGYKVGDVRGAISVSVPMQYALSMISSEKRTMVTASFATISILMIVLFVMMKELVLRPVNQLKSSIDDFSRGNRTETTVIKTGDELEELSRSFVGMSKSLREYHSDLESKVKIATKSFEEANERLSELNEKKSDFIAKISHELRTPMTSIKGAMDYISAKILKITGPGRDREELVEFLDVLNNNADRLTRMVNDTLDLERLESGMFDLHIDYVDIISLIKEVIISFQSLTEERKITFKILAKPEIIVNADEDRMRQVLINLISNAINFCPDDSEIEFEVIEEEERVQVIVKDKGPGIPADVRKKIFDKFYTIGKRRGTGLGLAICKGIIEAHNGAIMVLDVPDGQGSAIAFTLQKKKGDALNE